MAKALRKSKARASKSARRRKSRRKAKPENVFRSSTAIVPAQPQALAVPSAAPTFKNLVENTEKIRRFISRHLNVDLNRKVARLKPGEQLEQSERERLEIDWGTIPGVDKPFLKQPGAEKCLLWLHSYPQFHKTTQELGEGHLEMVAYCTIHSKKTHEILFEGPECSCSTMESNFRFRWVERKDRPEQKEAEELKRQGLGKWRRKAVWAHGKPQGEEWVWLDRSENPNIHDERNKVRQIGEKRALVKAVRQMGAMSEIFLAGPDEWEVSEETDDPYLHDQDYTQGGRQIVREDGTAPSGMPVSHAAKVAAAGGPKMKVGQEYTTDVPTTGSHDATQEIARKKIEQYLGKTFSTLAEAEAAYRESQKKPSEGVLGAAWKREHEKKADMPPREPKASPAPPVQPQAKPQGTVEVDWADSQSPIIRGDIGNLVELIQKHCKATWGKDSWWHILPSDVPTIKQTCKEFGYEVKEVFPSKASGGVRHDLPEKPTATGRGSAGASDAAPAVVLKGVIEKVNMGMVGKNTPTREVRIGKTWHKCFSQTLHEFLDGKHGKVIGVEAEVYIQGPYKNLVGFKRLGSREFLEDGKTPVIQRDEPRGGNLFA